MNKQQLLKYLAGVCLALVAGFSTSCEPDKVEEPQPQPQPQPVDNDKKTLKEVATFPIGVGVNYNLLLNDPAYGNVVKENFNSLTFEYQMKHGAVAKDDGTYNFSQVDEMVAWARQNNMRLFGHTLAWHQNNNANYLRSLTVGESTVGTQNLLANGSFEAGSGNDFTGWSKYNGSEYFTAASGANVKQGERALKVTVAQGTPGEQWRVQLASDPIQTQVGKNYQVSFWAKAEATGGSLRLSTQPTAAYQGDQNITTDWSKFTWTFTARDPETRVLFDMGAKANTYYIDEVMVAEVTTSTPAANEEVVARLDNALKDWITTTVTRYKDDVDAWDVVNEAITDNTGLLRTNPTPGTPPTGDVFYWAEYLGKDYIKKAFQYAHEADPDALLFLNDYNQEVDAKKLNAMVALVNELKAEGVPIHGVGLQMHISVNTPNAGIDRALAQLASTGLMVHISEVDVKANPNKTTPFSLTPSLATQQAKKVEYIVDSYQRNVPAAQRYGITFWNVTPRDSWITADNPTSDSPTLFTSEYEKKEAYFAALQALKLE